MNEPRVVESVTNECQSLGRAHESSSARAEQLIACLEGEIAKRDARIAELESQYQRDVYGLNNEGDPIGGDPVQQVSVPDGEDWSVFFGYLIDKCEGHIIAEENLQGWLSEMLADPHYCALFRREKTAAEQYSPIAMSIEAAEEEHGSLRAAAKALGIDHGYLYRLKSGEKINPGADVLKALGLERITYYRSMLNAAPAAPAADAGLVEARKANNELVNDLHVMTNKRRQLVDALTYLRECLDPDDYMGEISMHDFIDDALAAHRAKGVV